MAHMQTFLNYIVCHILVLDTNLSFILKHYSSSWIPSYISFYDSTLSVVVRILLFGDWNSNCPFPVCPEPHILYSILKRHQQKLVDPIWKFTFYCDFFSISARRHESTGETWLSLHSCSDSVSLIPSWWLNSFLPSPNTRLLKKKHVNSHTLL